jgi:uncharacterized integral membrane protein (TIGR00697 family)
MFYMALFVMAPILTNKILEIGPFTMPAGQFFVTLIMVGMIDVMNQREGLKEARGMLLNGLIVKSLIYLIVIPLAIAMPAAPFWHGQEIYQKFLGESIRFFIAAECVNFIGQYVISTKIFASIKNGNWFARVLTSDLVSQSLQTMAFMVISYYGTGKPIMLMFVSTMALTMILSIIKSIILYPLTLKRKQ